MAEELRKEEKKVVLNGNLVNEFKKMSELKKEDVSKLDSVPFTVKILNTKYGTSYTGSIPFGLGHINFKLDEGAVLLIAEIRKVENYSSGFTVQAFVRYVKGTDKNNNEYHQAQLLVGTSCYFTSLLSQRDLTLMNLWVNNGKMKPINFITCPKNEVETGLGFFED